MLRAAGSVHTSEPSPFLPLLSTLRAIPVGSSLLLYAQSLTRVEIGSRLLRAETQRHPVHASTGAGGDCGVEGRTRLSGVRESDTAM